MLRGNVACDKILTDAAKDAIRRYIQDHDSQDFEEVKEPPYMLPSTDPDGYSYVGAVPDSVFNAC